MEITEPTVTKTQTPQPPVLSVEQARQLRDATLKIGQGRSLPLHFSHGPQGSEVWYVCGADDSVEAVFSRAEADTKLETLLGDFITQN